MITRRQLRIKALQSLYGQRATERSLTNTVQAMEDSLKNIYGLFLLEAKALGEFHRFEEERLERGKKKKMPTAEDMNPNMAMVDNPILRQLRFDDNIHALYDEYSVRWGDDRDLLFNVYKKLIESPVYEEYKTAEQSLDNQKAFILEVYTQFFAYNDTLHELYEERNIHWSEDLEAVQMLVVSLIKQSTESKLSIPDLFKSEEDHEFALQLLKKTIQNSDYFEEIIGGQTKNWEADRIALIDKLLMKLALAELIYFSQIPIKVTFNEYIELSKQFSTSKSGVFINGVLDKLTAQLKEEQQIKKIGKGLL